MCLINATLRWAAERDNVLLAKMLVCAGADPYDTDGDGRTSFNRAASNGLRVLALLTEMAFADTQTDRGRRRWPAYGVNTPSGAYGSTLITYAVKACRADTVTAMMDAGADVRIVNGSGWSLLHCAAVMPGRADVIKSLLRAFRAQGHSDRLSALTTHVYETVYGGHKVIYATGLTAADLCRARLAQDPACPQDLNDYLLYLP
jgi:ankyrin repeat protein